MTTVDFASKAFIDDPHPTLHRLRAEDPVHRSAHGFWLLTRYSDVAALLRSPRLGTSRSAEQFRALYGDGPTFAFASRRFQYFDPPDHTRIRSLVTKAFTLRRVEAMRPRMREIVDGLIDSSVAAGAAEFVTDIAHPLPAIVICEMLGVPEEDQPQLSRWASTIPFIIAPVIEPERLADADAAIGAFFDYVSGMIAARRARPGDDLLSALMSAEDEGRRLSEEELRATVIFLFSAGHHTTRNLVSNGVYTLLREPARWRRLVDDPALVVPAIEECLRYEPSINFAPRRARETLVLEGGTIPAGDLVFLSLAGANRDPARFAEPDDFRIERTDNDHVAFGGGIHHCLGASLARAEAQTLLAAMVARLPHLALTGGPVAWRQTMTYRGPEALPVTLG
ncbi:MAG: cytochrome P450 [Hyphomicrobiaceae bacterium]